MLEMVTVLKMQPRFWEFDAIHFAIFGHTEVFQGLKTFHCLKVSSSSLPYMARTKSTSLKFASNAIVTACVSQSLSDTHLWRSDNGFASHQSAYTG